MASFLDRAFGTQETLREPSPFPPLPEPEYESALSRAAHMGLGGLELLGHVLGTLGRPVRTALAGRWEDVLPSVLYPSRAASGEDLAKQWGWLQGEGEKGTFEARDLVGPGIELATDPLSYFTPFPKTIAGGLAKKAGILPKTWEARAASTLGAMEPSLRAGSTIPLTEGAQAVQNAAKASGVNLAEHIDRPLGAVGKLSLPFVGGEGLTFGGPGAAALGDRAYDYLRGTAPVRFGASLFNSAVRGATSLIGQKTAVNAGELIRAAEPATLELPLRARHELGGAAPIDPRTLFGNPATLRGGAKVLYDTLNEEFANLGKTVPSGVTPSTLHQPKLIRSALEETVGLPPQHPLGQVVASDWNASRKAMNSREQEWGRDAGMLAESSGLDRAHQPLSPTAQSARDTIFRQYETAQGWQPGSIRPSADQGPPVQYGARGRTPLSIDTQARTGDVGASVAQFNAGGPWAAAREELYTQIPYGTPVLEEMIKDPTLRGTTPAVAADRIAKKYFGISKGEANALENASGAMSQEVSRIEALQTLGNATPADLDRLEALKQLQARRELLTGQLKQAEKLADRIQSPDMELYARTAAKPEGLDIYGHPLYDMQERGLHHARSMGMLQAQHGAIAEQARLLQPGDIPLPEALKQLDISFQTTGSPAIPGPYIDPAFPWLGRHPGTPAVPARGGLTKQLELLSGRIPNISTEADLAKVGVPKSLVDDLSKINQHAQPEATNRLLQLFDAATNWIRSWQTSALPFAAPSLARNVGQNIFYNNLANLTQPGLDPIMGTMKPFISMEKLTRVPGSVWEDANKIPAFAHLSPKEATKAFLDAEYAANDYARRGVGQMYDVAGSGAPTLMHGGSVPGLPMPGEQSAGVGEAFAKFADPKAYNPLDVRGQGFSGAYRRTTGNPLVAAGQALNEQADLISRRAGFAAGMLQGMTPTEAAKAVEMAQLNYGALSDFEKKWMRRIAPFYNWTKQNAVAMGDQMLAEPGGKAASIVKMINALHKGEGYVPADVREMADIPLGQTDEGRQRFLTRFQLPMESPLDMLSLGPGGIEKTGRDVLSQLNPLLKAPLEMATNRQFMTGRELAAVPTKTGLPMVLDQLLMNSPFSRPTRAAQTAFSDQDPVAKLMNLVGPGQIREVDLEKSKRAEARDLAERLLEGTGGIHRYGGLTVSRDQAAALTPEQTYLMRLLRTMQSKNR